ncbi:putative serine/arginine repetitive matrix protein 1 [Trichinella spiralis]|uniref:putative serine/arginine repetitive matrix protein 1 n=1 Tax=Trichinella spiralis TaxID=6334 RepID=UPI0001EFDFB4|nr:putative serine/arginine repetitive matrix protein 1 [Trichinella spiralis]
MKRIDLDVMRLWITKRVSEILGMEDDVVVEFVLNQLEEEDMDPRNMQINLTGFLNAKKAREFMGELWDLLIDAQNSECGIPQTLINAKAEYLRSRSAEERLASLDDPPSPELKNDSPTAREESEERPVRGYDSSSKVSPSKSRDARHKERESRFRRRPIPSPRRSMKSIVQADEKCKKIDAMKKTVIFDTLALINQKRSRSLSKEPNEKRISRKRENAYSYDRRRRDRVDEKNHKSYKKKRSRSIGESDSSVEDNVNRDRMSRKPQLKRERVKKRTPFERRISSPDTSHGLDEKIKCVDNRVNTPDKQRTESESEATGRTRKRSSQNITQTKDDSDISPAKVLKNSYTDNYGTSAEEEKEAENNQKNNKLYQLQPPDGNKLSVNDDKVLPKNFTSDERKALEAVTPPLQRKSLGCKFDETDFDKELVKKKRSSSESLLDDEHSDEKKKAKLTFGMKVNERLANEDVFWHRNIHICITFSGSY